MDRFSSDSHPPGGRRDRRSASSTSGPAAGGRGQGATGSGKSTWIGAGCAAARRGLWFPALVFVAHLIASRLFHVYDSFPHLDIPMHLVGGFAIAYFFHVCLGILVDRGLIPHPGGATGSILLFALVCTAAVFWEFAEYVSDRTLDTRAQLSLEDTLADLLLGIVGGSVFLVGVAARHRHSEPRSRSGLPGRLPREEATPR